MGVRSLSEPSPDGQAMLNSEFRMLNKSTDRHNVLSQIVRTRRDHSSITPEIDNDAIGNQVAKLPRMKQGQDLKARTRQFAIDVIRFCLTLPSTFEGRRLGGQLFDSGTSVGSNYRAVCRARSRADFIAKLGIVIEEVMPSSLTRALRQEALELVAVFTASQKTARENGKN